MTSPDFERPSTPARRGLFEPIGTCVALACAAVAVLGVVAMRGGEERSDDYAPQDLPTMADVNRWTREGCSTDADCERWDRWSELVCSNAEACSAAGELGALSPAFRL